MPNIGPLELVIALVIILVIFGPKRLPGLGKQLGTGMREFKDSVTGGDDDKSDTRAEITASTPEEQEQDAAAKAEAEKAFGRRE